MTVYESTVAKLSIAPAVRTNGTVNGAAVNLGLNGCDSAMAVFVTGVVTDGSHAGTVEESDTGTSGWSAIPAGRIVGGALPTITLTNDDATFEVGFVPQKAFVRAVVATTGATTGGTVAAIIVAGEPGSAPVSHA